MSNKSDREGYRGKHLERTNSLSISPELFEKLFLSPQNVVKGDFRQMFGVPTPIALVGFAVALSPLSIGLMGWRGSGGAADLTVYYFFGGLMLELGGILEFILGNTFPFTVFCGYGSWFLTYAGTFQPFFDADFLYDPDSPAAGAATPEYLATFAFLVLFMAVLSFIFLICSLRTNVVFVIIFIGAMLGFACISAGLFHFAEGGLVTGGRLLKAGGGCFFVASMAGWYMTFAVMLAVLDFPFQVPVFDLSTVIKGYSEKQKAEV